jgi:hypothetical protein
MSETRDLPRDGALKTDRTIEAEMSYKQWKYGFERYRPRSLRKLSMPVNMIIDLCSSASIG